MLIALARRLGMPMLMAVIVGFMRGVWAEQRAFQVQFTEGAGPVGQAKQRQRRFELATNLGHLGFIGLALGGMLKPHQVHGRALQLDFQALTVEDHIERSGAVFVGGEAAVFGMLMFVLMLMAVLMGLGEGQGQ